MKNKPWYKFVCCVLSICLLWLPIPVKTAHGETLPAATTISKDKDRMTKYRAVINLYLNEVLYSINTGSYGGQEYLADVLASDSGQKIGDYKVAAFVGDESAEFKAFKANVAKILADFKVKYESPRGSLGSYKDTAYGSLVMSTIPMMNLSGNPGVLYYRYLGQSPYPIVYDSVRRTYVRKAGQSEAQAYYAGLVTRNQVLSSALAAYITQVQKYTNGTFVWEDLNSRAPEEMFTMAKATAKFAYTLTRTVPKYKTTLARLWFERSVEIYTTWKDYFDKLFALTTGAWGSSTSGGAYNAGAAVWDEYQEVGTLRYEWNAYYYKLKTITHSVKPTDPPSGFLVLDRDLIRQDAVASIADLPYSHNTGRGGNTSFLVMGWRGNFPSDAAEAFARKVLADPVLNPSQYPPGYADTVALKYRGQFDLMNKTYVSFLELQKATSNKLNGIMVKYERYFPYSLAKPTEGPTPYRVDVPQHRTDNYGYDYISTYLGAGEILTPNQAPVANAGTYTSDIIPFEYVLDARSAPGRSGEASYDPDPKDILEYRWVITAMPLKTEARSDYVLYQPLSVSNLNATYSWSGSSGAKFKPDIAGTWEVGLDINDGKDISAATIKSNSKIMANRKILWIAHSNGPFDPETGLGIELQLYHYSDAAGVSAEYYVEVSHEDAGVYFNYDDNGKPVDRLNGYVPSGVFCFRMSRDPAVLGLGGYDGAYGASDLVHQTVNKSPNKEMLRDTPCSFTLVSAYNLNTEYIPIQVSVFDPNISNLELPTATATYGQKISPPLRTGTYTIAQWVDHKAWINEDGKGFVEKPKMTPEAYHDCPDWMERRAVETLNAFPQALTCVQKVGVCTDSKLYGYFDPKIDAKLISINPNFSSMRYNLKSSSGYGFVTAHNLDGCARHEAHHAFRRSVVVNPLSTIDNDGDGLMNSDLGGMFDYLLDSGVSHKFGKTGPKPREFAGLNPISFYYLGDREIDVGGGQLRQFLHRQQFAVNSVPRTINLFVPANLPVEQNIIGGHIQVYMIGYENGEAESYSLKEGKDFTVDNSGMTRVVQPTLSIRLSDAWAQGLPALSTQLPVLNAQNNVELCIEYQVEVTHEVPLLECEASRIEPGEYVGGWKVE